MSVQIARRHFNVAEYYKRLQTLRHVCDDVGHDGQRGDASGEFLRVDLVEGVGLRVVDVEVVRAVNVERGSVDAGLHHGRDVRAFAVGVDVVCAEAREEFGDLREVGAGLRRGLFGEAEARGAEDAGVGLDGEDVACEFRLVRFRVACAAARAVLFVGEEDDADGASRAESETLEKADGLPGGDDAAAVVLRALTHVPGIYVAADDDYLFGLLASFNLGDDVSRLGVGEEVRAHR